MVFTYYFPPFIWFSDIMFSLIWFSSYLVFLLFGFNLFGFTYLVFPLFGFPYLVFSWGKLHLSSGAISLRSDWETDTLNTRDVYASKNFWLEVMKTNKFLFWNMSLLIDWQKEEIIYSSYRSSIFVSFSTFANRQRSWISA